MYRFFYLLLSVWATRVMVDWDSKWEIWNTFPSPRPVSGPFVQNLPIDRPMKNVSSVRLIGRVSSQKNLSLFSFELSHMREPYHQASLSSLSCVLENRTLRGTFVEVQMGLTECYILVLIGNSCTLTFYHLPGMGHHKAKQNDSSFSLISCETKWTYHNISMCVIYVK